MNGLRHIQPLLLTAFLGCHDSEPETRETDQAASVTTGLTPGASAPEQCADPIHCSDTQLVLNRSVVTPFMPEEASRQDPRLPPPTGQDSDGDGYPAERDCDDANPGRYPGAVEIQCDGIDQNCDGVDTCDHDKDGYVDAVDCAPFDPKVTNQCWVLEPGKPLR